MNKVKHAEDGCGVICLDHSDTGSELNCLCQEASQNLNSLRET